MHEQCPQRGAYVAPSFEADVLQHADGVQHPPHMHVEPEPPEQPSEEEEVPEDVAVLPERCFGFAQHDNKGAPPGSATPAPALGATVHRAVQQGARLLAAHCLHVLAVLQHDTKRVVDHVRAEFGLV